MYEKKHQPPITHRAFAWRLVLHLLAVSALLVLSLVAGMGGFMALEGQGSVDAFLSASMLLSGMGPVGAPVTQAGKLFAGGYALYSGVVFLICMAWLLSPVLHRVLHRFHWSEDL